MKQIFKSLVLVAAAVATLTSCEKAPEVTPTPEEFTLTVNATLPAPAGTKTYLGELDATNGYPVLWSEGDAVKVYELSYVDGVKDVIHNAVSTSTELSADSKTATFKGLSFTDETPSANADEFEYLALYGNTTNEPANKYANYKSWTLKIPTEQTPAAVNQFDSAAALMVAYDADNATRQSTLDLDFHHVGAYGMLNIVGFDCGNEVIKSVTFSTPQTDISGNVWYYYIGNTTSPANQNTNKEVTVNLSSIIEDIDYSNFNACFVATPSTFEEGDVIKIVITTDSNTYTKSITLNSVQASALKFVKGEIVSFSADFSSVTADPKGDKYEKVTSLTNLADGDEIILVIATDGDYYAAGTLTSNKYPGKGITESAGVIYLPIGNSDYTVLRLSQNVVTADNVKWSLYDTLKNKYLGYSSGTNFAQVDSASDNNGGFWKITESTDGKFSITNVKTNTRGILYQFSNQNKFAPYATSNLTSNNAPNYSEPYIYKKVN